MNEKDILETNKIILESFAEMVSRRTCPDQKLFDLKFRDNIRQGTLAWKRESINPSSKKRIVLIVESPHKDEFRNGDLGEPVSGSSGTNLFNDFDLFIERILECYSDIKLDGEYELILINSIQQQCSMGITTGLFRTISFIGQWFKGGKVDFEKRLSDLDLTEHDIIVNACTIGKGNNNNPNINTEFDQESLKVFFSNPEIRYVNSRGIKHLVSQSIELVIDGSDIKLINTNHPSNWKGTKSSIKKEC